MTDAKSKMKKAYIIRDFHDAGTEKQFTAGMIVEIDEGSFLNYEAGRLVREPTPEDAKAKPAADASAGKAA